MMTIRMLLDDNPVLDDMYKNYYMAIFRIDSLQDNRDLYADPDKTIEEIFKKVTDLYEKLVKVEELATVVRIAYNNCKKRAGVA